MKWLRKSRNYIKDKGKRSNLDRAPKVSVIIPCYNAEKYVRDSVESIIKQTYKALEIILLDDGSSDDTYAILQELKKTDPRIVLMKHESNKGLIASLNDMVDAADGEYIARMDSDDIAREDRIEKQIEYLESRPEVGLCGSNVVAFDEKGIRGILKYPEENYSIIKCLPFFSPFAHPTVVARANVLKDNKYDENYKNAEDFELWCRLLLLSKVKAHNIQDELLYYRISKTQISSRSLNSQNKVSMKILSIYDLLDDEEKDIHEYIYYDGIKKFSREDVRKYIINQMKTLETVNAKDSSIILACLCRKIIRSEYRSLILYMLTKKMGQRALMSVASQKMRLDRLRR